MADDELERRAHFASIFVLPFAGVVSAELQEYGISKHKSDEILLRAVKRFGTEIEKHPPNFAASNSEENTAGNSWFSDFYKNLPPLSPVLEKGFRILIQEMLNAISKKNTKRK